jgi:hypothetical protein
MAPNPPLAPEISRAENIALLYLLHSVPTLPSANPVDSQPIRQNGYTLPFPRERRLTGTLAFLSSINDDPNHIPAVCVEEDPQSATLSVLLAVNRRSSDGGKQVLRKLKQGFERVFAPLSRLSEGEWSRVPPSLPLLIVPRWRWCCNHRG